ncbi:phosphoribosylaminoimidazole carboxylase ATPase subunit [Vibrio astriarenae]|nr:phosphoribosylaminoimidazole carboxylase ATPase subunit [Vibrio sp. C7]
MGHINVCADSNEELVTKLVALARELDKEAYPAVHEFAAQH